MTGVLSTVLSTVTMTSQRYELGADCTDSGCGTWIKCLDCNRKSYHPMDVSQRYCGRCKRYLEEAA